MKKERHSFCFSLQRNGRRRRRSFMLHNLFVCTKQDMRGSSYDGYVGRGGGGGYGYSDHEENRMYDHHHHHQSEYDMDYHTGMRRHAGPRPGGGGNFGRGVSYDGYDRPPMHHHHQPHHVRARGRRGDHLENYGDSDIESVVSATSAFSSHSAPHARRNRQLG